MNKNTFIAAIVVIALMPFVYLLLAALKGEELPRFHGREVVLIDPANGNINVPSSDDAQSGKPLTASFTTAFVEQVTERNLASAKGLNLTVHTISEKAQDCEVESAIPARAGYKIAEMCAPFAFEKSKEPKKTALFIAPEEHFIVFGKSGQNLTRVYHHGMVATYESSDMTQSDRKNEACVVRIMMDYIIGIPRDPDAPCVAKP